MQSITHSLGFLKNMLLIYFVISSTNLFAQGNEEQILNINLGLYVCENALSKEVPKGEIYGFDCAYRKDMNNEIEIVSVVLNQNTFIDDHKEECIKRISTIDEIYNAIQGTPVNQSGRTNVDEENWLWGASEGYLQGFLDHTLNFGSLKWNKQVAYLKNSLLFHVNVIDKGMFDENEETKTITMCFWKYGQGVNNPYINEY
jgi:hypothetical protein